MCLYRYKVGLLYEKFALGEPLLCRYSGGEKGETGRESISDASADPNPKPQT